MFGGLPRALRFLSEVPQSPLPIQLFCDLFHVAQDMKPLVYRLLRLPPQGEELRAAGTNAVCSGFGSWPATHRPGGLAQSLTPWRPVSSSMIEPVCIWG